LESRRLFLDQKEEIQFSWETLENVQFTQNGNEMRVKVSNLAPACAYTVRAVAISSTGTVVARTAEADFMTLPKPPLVTLLRFLLFCLVGLVALVARQWLRKE